MNSTQQSNDEIKTKRINQELTENEEKLYRINMFISGRYIELKMKKNNMHVEVEKKLDVLRDKRKEIISGK